jgi:mono/diheme cytochrome c family protein
VSASFLLCEYIVKFTGKNKIMYKGFLHTHYLVVTLFLLIYVVKTILLLSDKRDLLANFTRKVKVFEMIVSALFLITGIYLATQLPFNGKYDYLFWIKLIMVFASIPLAIIGFKRGNKILAALSLLLITGSYGIAEVYSKRKGIAKDGAAQNIAANDGKALYNANCASCHGADGKLGASGAMDISTSQLDVQGMKDIILHGRNLMQPVNVSDEQATAIATYVNENIKGH